MENETNIKRFCVRCGKEFEADKKTHLCSKKCILDEYKNRIKNTCLYCCEQIKSNGEFEIISSNGYYQKCHLSHFKNLKGMVESKKERIKDLLTNKETIEKDKDAWEKELETFKKQYEKELIVDEL